MKLLLLSITLLLVQVSWAQSYSEGSERHSDFGIQVAHIDVQALESYGSPQIDLPNSEQYEDNLTRDTLIIKETSVKPAKEVISQTKALQLFANPPFGHLVIEGNIPIEASLTLLSTTSNNVLNLFSKNLSVEELFKLG